MSALKFLSREGVEGAKKYGGIKTVEVFPENVKKIREEIAGLVRVLEERREEEPFGANNLSLDENTIIVPDSYPELAEELKKRDMEVIVLPFEMTITYGAGPRCLTAVLKRDR